MIARSLELVDLLTWRRVNREAANWILGYLDSRGIWSCQRQGPPLRKLQTDILEAADIVVNLQLTHLHMTTWAWIQELPFGNDHLSLPPQMKLLTNLTTLSISIGAFDDWIYSLPQLRNLTLQGVRERTDEPWEDLPNLTPLTALTSLRIDGLNVPDEAIMTLTNLRKLDLFQYKLFTGRSFTFLRRLRSLVMEWGDSLGQWSSLAGLSELRRLSLNESRITDSELKAISIFPQLRSLSVSGCLAITSEGLSRFTGLTQLDIYCLYLNLDSLPTLETLETLSVPFSQLTETTLRRLTRLRRLSGKGHPGLSLDWNLLPSLRHLEIYYHGFRSSMTHSMVDLSSSSLLSLATDYPVSDLSLLPLTLRSVDFIPACPLVQAQLEARGVKFLSTY